MTPEDVMQVASVLDILRRDYGMKLVTDLAFGPLKAYDFRVIASGIEEDWTAHAIAEHVAERHKLKRLPVS